MGAAAGDAVEMRYNVEIGKQTQERRMHTAKVNMQSWNHSTYPNVSFCYSFSECISFLGTFHSADFPKVYIPPKHSFFLNDTIFLSWAKRLLASLLLAL